MIRIPKRKCSEYRPLCFCFAMARQHYEPSSEIHALLQVNLAFSFLHFMHARADSIHSTKVLWVRLYTKIPCVSMHAQRSHMHVKDPVINVRFWWIIETLRHPECTAGWAAQLCRSWFGFPRGQQPKFPLTEIQMGQYSKKKKKKPKESTPSPTPHPRKTKTKIKRLIGAENGP